MSSENKKMNRRDVLRGGTGVLGATLLGGAATQLAFANNHPHPNQHSLDYLDPNTYIDKVEVHHHMDIPWGAGGKSQMMAKGARRFLFNAGKVWDVSDAMHPELVNDKAWPGSQFQLAWNENVGKWILMTSASPPPTSAHRGGPRGGSPFTTNPDL